MALPMRDFNQELGKTRGLARAHYMAVREFIHHSGIVTDKDDYEVRAMLESADVLADRLDDLCHMNDEQIKAADRKLRAVGG